MAGENRPWEQGRWALSDSLLIRVDQFIRLIVPLVSPYTRAYVCRVRFDRFAPGPGANKSKQIETNQTNRQRKKHSISQSIKRLNNQTIIEMNQLSTLKKNSVPRLYSIIVQYIKHFIMLYYPPRCTIPCSWQYLSADSIIETSSPVFFSE